MPRRRNRRPLVPEARDSLDDLKARVMAKNGYKVDQDHPEQVKYEVADDLGIPLEKGYNGDLKAEQAGRIGGAIGGKMVRELVKMAQEQLTKERLLQE